jgi:hypothetical protein
VVTSGPLFGRSWPRCRCSGRTRELFQTPGFGDTIDFDHIKWHYFLVCRYINPIGIIPAGPDLSGWTTPHGREALGGRPFREGTPPPPRREETIRQSTPRSPPGPATATACT